MTTKVFTAHLSDQMAEKVEQIAARLERSRGWVIKQALSMWIDQEEEHYRLTMEALDDVDKGKVIDHKHIQDWAASLGTKTPLAVPHK